MQSMDEYKQEKKFKRCLEKLQLNHVLDAIVRAKTIMQINNNNGYILHEYKGYSYYEENTSLDVWVAIEKILETCGLAKKSV